MTASFTGLQARELLSAWTHETGLTPDGGATVTPGDFDAPDGAFFIALDGAEPVGCGGLRRLDADTGEVKRLFVRRVARGRGAGRALMDAIEAHARSQGLARLRLDTTGNAAALALFRARGYDEIPDYNGNARARWWFEKPLVSSTASTAPGPRPTDR